jgi:hypothetical protein
MKEYLVSFFLLLTAGSLFLSAADLWRELLPFHGTINTNKLFPYAVYEKNNHLHFLTRINYHLSCFEFHFKKYAGFC